MRRLHALLIAVAALLLASHPSLAERKQTSGQIMIVLDASGSMWGKIGGRTKIDIARGVIRDLMRTWDERLAVGLTAYGHRRKDACDDIQVIVPIGGGGPKAIVRAVNRLQPRGKTPLSAAVQQAAEALKYTEKRAAVILVSDGKETCGADPCALGRALKQNGIDFTVHVVGFGVNRAEEKGLRCLAKATGGIYVRADDPKSLARAIKKSVREVRQPKPTPPPQPKQQAQAEAGVKLIAVYKQGGKAFEGQIGWSIWSPERDLAGKRKLIAKKWRGRSGHIFRKIKPGRYVVRAELADHRHIVREMVVEVTSGTSIHTIVLNIGKVRFDAKLTNDSAAYKGDLGWSIISLKTDLAGKRKRIANFWRKKSGGVFILPAGRWLVVGELADWRYVKVSKEIAVEAGSGEAHEFVFNAGTVRFDAVLADGGPTYKGGLGWNIFETKTNLAGKRKRIAGFWRKKSGSIFILPAGNWLVTGVFADHRHVNVQREITVAPGSETPHSFNFRAGVVRFDVTAEGKPFAGQVGLTVFGSPTGGLKDKRPRIANFWRKRSGHITYLPEGSYLVTGLNADQRKQTGKSEITVRAGKEHRTTIDLTEE